MRGWEESADTFDFAKAIATTQEVWMETLSTQYGLAGDVNPIGFVAKFFDP